MNDHMLAIRLGELQVERDILKAELVHLEQDLACLRDEYAKIHNEDTAKNIAGKLLGADFRCSYTKGRIEELESEIKLLVGGD